MLLWLANLGFAGSAAEAAQTAAGSGAKRQGPRRTRRRPWEDWQRERVSKERELRAAVIARADPETSTRPIKRILSKPRGSTHGLFNPTALTNIRTLASKIDDVQMRALADELEAIVAELETMRRQRNNRIIALLLLDA